MGRDEHNYSDLLIYALGFSLALAIALSPSKALSGQWDTAAEPPPGPRWSNDHHIADSVIVTPDCVLPAPGQAAEYVPGYDAWGRPVAPADSHTGLVSPPPVEVEVHLKSKRIGRRTVDVTTGEVVYDPATNTLGGYPLARDCTPYFK